MITKMKGKLKFVTGRCSFGFHTEDKDFFRFVFYKQVEDEFVCYGFWRFYYMVFV